MRWNTLCRQHMKGSFRRCCQWNWFITGKWRGNCLYRTVAIYPQNTSDDRNGGLSWENIHLAAGHDGICLYPSLAMQQDESLYQRLHILGMKQLSIKSTGVDGVRFDWAQKHQLTVTNVLLIAQHRWAITLWCRSWWLYAIFQQWSKENLIDGLWLVGSYKT